MVAAVIHAAVPCVCDRAEVMALGQQIAMFCLFFSPRQLPLPVIF